MRRSLNYLQGKEGFAGWIGCGIITKRESMYGAWNYHWGKEDFAEEKKTLDFVENFETTPKERKSLLSKKKCVSGWRGGGTMVALRGKEGQEDNG